MTAAPGLSRVYVHSYQPYTKIPYNMDELSVNADRIRMYREWKKRCFCSRAGQMTVVRAEEALRRLLIYLSGCVFLALHIEPALSWRGLTRSVCCRRWIQP